MGESFDEARVTRLERFVDQILESLRFNHDRVINCNRILNHNRVLNHNRIHDHNLTLNQNFARNRRRNRRFSSDDRCAGQR